MRLFKGRFMYLILHVNWQSTICSLLSSRKDICTEPVVEAMCVALSTIYIDSFELQHL